MRRKRKPQPPLPPPCADCRPYEGLWCRSDSGGMERCGCARGQALRFARRKGRGKESAGGFDGRAAGANDR